MERLAWEKWAAILFCFFAGGAVVWLVGSYLLPILLPFFLAWLISLPVRSLSKRVSQGLGIPRGISAAILLTLLLALLTLLSGFLLRRLMQELSRLLGRLLEAEGNLFGLVDESFDLFAFLMERLGIHPDAAPGYEVFRAGFYEMMSDVSAHLVEVLSEGIPKFASKVFLSLPSIFFFLVITVIAAFYFCMAERSVASRLCEALPISLKARIPVWRSRVKQLSWRYAKVYLLLLALTFGELFLGFLILGVDYAFLLALTVAILDMLPILGVGTVLIPWALVSFFQRNFYLGFGLAILYLVTLILRQVMEPRLLGKSLGLHPLLTLFAGYAGWRLFGFLGMVIGPVAAMLIKNTLTPNPKGSPRKGQ